MENSKQIIGFINTTLKGYSIVFGVQAEENRARKIILSICGDMIIKSQEFKDVQEYVFNNYKIKI